MQGDNHITNDREAVDDATDTHLAPRGARGRSTRAGAYTPQVGGYSTFKPKPLPPDPPLIRDDELLRLLSLADQALGRLDGASDTLPNPDLFVAMYVNDEAVQSSQIEGTQATLLDVLAFEAAAAEPNNPQDIEEVVNYIAALKYGLEQRNTLPISKRLLREIHKRLLAGVRGSERDPGEFRRTQNAIGHRGATFQTAQFIPPSPDDMQQALSDLERFIHAEDTIPPLLKIGLIHAQFETIHPFLDGNGRIGRLLITLFLCERQILSRPLLYLSYFINRNKIDYYARLQAVRDEGAWEDWLKFFLRGVHDVAQEATAKARAIVALREKHRALVARELSKGAGTGQRFLDFLYTRPVTTIKQSAQYLGISLTAANTLVGKFEKLGILVEMTQQGRNRRYAYHEYLLLFDTSISQPSPRFQASVKTPPIKMSAEAE